MNTASGKVNSFARNLKKLRTESGLSQEALADLIGTTGTTICRYEKGSQVPSPYYRAKLAEVFGVPGCSLFEEENTPDAYLPGMALKRIEALRSAMFMGDYAFVDEVVYEIYQDISYSPDDVHLTQAADFLKKWSFYHQGALKDTMLDELLNSLKLTRPGVTIDELIRPNKERAPFTFMELCITNAIGVRLIRTDRCEKAALLYRHLLDDREDNYVSAERRFLHKCIFAFNLSAALYRQGKERDAAMLLKMYRQQAYLYGSPFICLHLQIGITRCLEKVHSDSVSPEVFREKSLTESMHRILLESFDLKKPLETLKRENLNGLMLL